MKTELISVKKPETEDDCKSMKHCWGCSIFVGAAMGGDFFECFDNEKMKYDVELFRDCF